MTKITVGYLADDVEYSVHDDHVDDFIEDIRLREYVKRVETLPDGSIYITLHR